MREGKRKQKLEHEERTEGDAIIRFNGVCVGNREGETARLNTKP